MHFIEQVFGAKCDLYEILSCPRDADGAKLRKCYYRAALKYHPDRNRNSDSNDSHRQFQAISMCYRILHDADTRADYDTTGEIPEDDEILDDDDKMAASGNAGSDAWKKYFDNIFGKVTTGDIEAFAAKYKCSDEERRDVLKEFKTRQGNLVKMLEFVMLSEPRDAIRWVEDYIRPAMENEDGDAYSKFKATMEKTLKTCQKKAEKENREEEEDAEDEEEEEGSDDEDTETEEHDDDSSMDEEDEKKASSVPKKASSNKKKKKDTPVKANATKAKKVASKKRGAPATKGGSKKKKSGGGNNMSDLVAQIRNKNRGGGGSNNLFASLGARYGVAMDSDDDGDPLKDDAEFERIQTEMKNRKKNSQGGGASGGASGSGGSKKRPRK